MTAALRLDFRSENFWNRVIQVSVILILTLLTTAIMGRGILHEFGPTWFVELSTAHQLGIVSVLSLLIYSFIFWRKLEG